MSNKLEHASVGLAVASLRGCMELADLAPDEAIARTLGMLAGGYAGSRSPDWAEPPNRVGHWGPAHSVRMAGALALYMGAVSPDVHRFLNSVSQEYLEWERELASQGKTFQATLCWLSSLLIQMFTGFMVAFPTAYLSHLGMDQVTRKSDLPW